MSSELEKVGIDTPQTNEEGLTHNSAAENSDNTNAENNTAVEHTDNKGSEDTTAAEQTGNTVAEETAAAEQTDNTVAEETAAAEQTDNTAQESNDAKELTDNSAQEAVETMEDYTNELEASFREINEGDIITGTVIGIADDSITLDLKYYTDGIIRIADYSSNQSAVLKDEVKVGDEISATVIRKDDGEGHILLSSKEAKDALTWEKLQSNLENQTILDVKVGGVVKAGVIAYLEGVRGFIPASKLSLGYVENLEEWLGKEIQVRVITVDPEKKKLVLSAKEILREKADEERKALISNVEVGFVTEGTVESLQPYGAFIDLGNGLSGLVHISQISEKRIKTPAAVLKTGDKVKVKVIKVKDGKLSLSMKALNDVAAEEIREEVFDLPKSEKLTTSLGSLFKDIKLDD